MLLGANMPAGKGMNRTGEGIIRAGFGSKRFSVKDLWFKDFNATSSLTNFEILKHYQNEPRFNGVFILEKIYLIK